MPSLFDETGWNLLDVPFINGSENSMNYFLILLESKFYWHLHLSMKLMPSVSPSNPWSPWHSSAICSTTSPLHLPQCGISWFSQCLPCCHLAYELISHQVMVFNNRALSHGSIAMAMDLHSTCLLFKFSFCCKIKPLWDARAPGGPPTLSYHFPKTYKLWHLECMRLCN